ncbi:chromatin associated protein KTI12 [Rhizoctonia solani AG-3 Rhs1AP]|uniref:Chromatin associated protein KTI12 n=2 Tax=Rhizoctonia solani AG-3 TaxID=1086053 RepID=A0A074RGW2_9AGAM|nr:chromatin associated protein KTI12 [Rhizoctonia solani AG-3 Rhs1AP]KEP46346.1 chromatin associated protein KTI12 [Rhizoctonia solani 123E]
MALITFSGFPSSGKTRRTDQLRAYLEQKLQEDHEETKGWKVSVLSDEGLNIPRSSYDESRLEKPARSALLSAIVRDLSKNTILIVDSLNYIKGFRYQMYCAAREVGVRVATVFVVATPDLCREWNQKKENRYSDATFDNLIQRYEEPNSMVRWDAPLFTVPWTDETVPGEDVWRAITLGDKRPANQAVASIIKPPSDALQVLDQTTASVVGAIMSAQSTLGGSGGTVSLNGNGPLPNITLPSRHVSLPELSRHKRQFVAARKKAVTQGLAGNKGEMDWDAESVAEKFVEYLEENLAP